ncbi:alpha/beta fold hydrolase [bacterium]|nr:alpha/beta fold hydrolase [bacterium]
MKIYAISGLGADARVFARLQKRLGNLQVIDWKRPETDESLLHYARRMADEIDRSQPFVLLGLSFGGVVAQEICQFLKPDKLILLSSLQSAHELQPLIKLIKYTGLAAQLPLSFFRPPLFLCKWYFGTRDEVLLNGLIRDMDLELVKWSILQLLAWKAPTTHVETIRIHGTDDRLLYFVAGAIAVQGGHHFMVHDKAGEVADIIIESLQ